MSEFCNYAPSSSYLSSCWTTSHLTILVPLLAAIRDGHLAVMTRPPSLSNPDAGADWAEDQFEIAELDGLPLLDECRKRLERKYPNRSSWDRDLDVNVELASSMRDLQEQPALMSQYRRFVVIHAESMRGFPRDLKVMCTVGLRPG